MDRSIHVSTIEDDTRLLTAQLYNRITGRIAHCHHVCNLVQNTTLTYIAQRNVTMSLVRGQLIVTMSAIWSSTPPSRTLPSGTYNVACPRSAHCHHVCNLVQNTTLTYIAQRNVTMSLVRGQLIVTMSAIWSRTPPSRTLPSGMLQCRLSEVSSLSPCLQFGPVQPPSRTLPSGMLQCRLSEVSSLSPCLQFGPLHHPNVHCPAECYNVACPRSAHCHHVCNLVQNTTLTYIAQRNVAMSLVQGQLIVTMSAIWSRTPPSRTLPSGMLQCRLSEVPNTTLTYMAQRNVEMSLVRGQLIVTMSVIRSRTPPSRTWPSGMLKCRLSKVSSLSRCL
ncbi:hypothetical protein J6590_047266 [Homalodisca vitripennis]|nr:hypothetical protein J6590_047266 [Homalodisca vitripennis]